MRPPIPLVVGPPTKNLVFHTKARNLQQHLSADFEVVIHHDTPQVRASLENGELEYAAVLGLNRGLFSPRHRRLLPRIGLMVCSEWSVRSRQRHWGMERREVIELMRECRSVCFNNQRQVEDYSPYLDNVHYTPNGVNPAEFFPVPTANRSPGDILRVGFAAKLISHDNLPSKKGYATIKTALEGVAGLELRLAELPQQNNGPYDLDANRSEMNRFYQDIDIYVCASEEEGTPNPCLEAGLVGKPVITTPVGNMPELIHHGVNGLLFDVNDSERLRAHLILLRDNIELRLDLGQALRQTILRNWTWQHQSHAYAEFFRELAGS